MKTKTTTTMTLQQIIDSAVKEFNEKFQNPKNTGYRVGQEFLGAVEIFLILSIKKAVEEAYEKLQVEEMMEEWKNDTTDVAKGFKQALSLIEKKKSLFLHVCCDGECNHDSCCGKVKANCPINEKKSCGGTGHGMCGHCGRVIGTGGGSNCRFNGLDCRD